MRSALIAALIALAIGSAMMLVAGASPGVVWGAMIARTLGDPYLLGEVLYRATTLVFTGLAVSIALDAGLFNIGGEAQLTAGVVACAAVGGALPAGMPWMFAILICMLVAAAAGGAIGAAIGAMRELRGAHEVITSIMLDAIVAGVALWLGNEVLFVPGSTASAAIAPGAALPELGLGGSSANLAIVLAAGAVALVWWLRARTTWGTDLIAVGKDPAAARTAGIEVKRVRVVAMIAAGALGGLGATNLVLGHEHAYSQGLGTGSGFLGISVALLGRAHPGGVAIAALALGFLSAGGLAVNDLVPKELTEMLQGVVVLAVAAVVAFRARRQR